MLTIEKLKDQLILFKEEVLRKSNENDYVFQYGSEYDNSFIDISIISVEENIVLWKKTYAYDKSSMYLYTDLEGELLFNGRLFSFATPSSNSRVLIRNSNVDWRIIDFEKKEIVSLPNDIIFDNLNGFRNNNLAVFKENTWNWGSIKYNHDENSFSEDIPFIWDSLEFSRLNDNVYVGIHRIYSKHDYNPYFHWSEDFGNKFICSTIRIPINKAYDLEYYNYIMNMYSNWLEQNIIMYISSDIQSGYSQEERNQYIKDCIKSAYNISDLYFGESYKEENNSNNGIKVDLGNLSDYQKKKGVFKKSR